jgi:hypothetical protein
MSTHPSSGVFPMPDPIHATPRPESTVSAPAIDAGCEKLQVADTVEAIVEIVRDAIARRPGVGRGAVYLVCDRQEAVRRAFIQGPASADLSLPEIVLTGMARRAIREGIPVRQSGVAAGTLWASPLRSADGVEGVVAAVGEPGDVGTLLAHAGFALGRERRRAADLVRARLAAEHKLDLVVCIAAAQRRGLMDKSEAKRNGKDADNIAPGFRISGLGQLIEAGIQADRLVVFGD